MIVLPLLFWLLSTLARAGQPAPSPQPAEPRPAPPVPEALTGYVLVNSGISAPIRPKAGAPELPSKTSRSEGRVRAGEGRFTVFRALQRRGDWVQVETPGAVNHCAGGGYWDLRDVALRVWLPAQQLMAVVDEPVRIEAPDGTWVELGPGTPVMAAPDGASHHHRVAHGGWTLDVDVPSRALGMTYVPRAPEDALTVGNTASRRVPLAALEMDAATLVDGPSSVVVTRGGSTTVEGDPCLRFRARVANVAEAPSTDHYGVGGLGLRGTAGPTARVAAGSTVFWAEGHEAGRTLADIEFHTTSYERAGHTCFDRRIERHDDGPAQAVALCFGAQDVRAP